MHGRHSGDLILWACTELGSKTFDDAVTLSGGGKGPFHVSLVVDGSHLVHATDVGVVEETVKGAAERYLMEHDELKVTECILDLEEEFKTKAVEFARGKVGVPYNDTFSEALAEEGKAYYCCQLVRKAYEYAGAGKLISLRPLNFREENGKMIEYWVEYFKKKGVKIPEDGFGTHPADFLKCNLLKVVCEYKISKENVELVFSND